MVVYCLTSSGQERREMTNTALRELILKSGYKLSYVAAHCGLSRSGLYKKLQGVSHFRQDEIKALKTLLSLDENAVEEIFFS